MYIGIDLETYSPEDIKTAGMYRYAMHPDFEVLLCAVTFDAGNTVQVFDVTTDAGKNQMLGLLHYLLKPDTVCTAWNAPFEWWCLYIYYSRLGLISAPFPLSQWRDTMLLSQYLGYPSSLDAAGKAIGLPEDKQKLATGKALIRTFCVPRKPTAKDARTRIYPSDEPEKWELFKTYNRGDVVTEQEILRRLSKWPVPDDVQAQWGLDTWRNSVGVCLDLPLVDGAIDISERSTSMLLEEAGQLTGLSNPNSRDQLQKWLMQELPDTEIQDLRKDTVNGLLGIVSDETVTRVLEIRQETGKAAVKKFKAARKMVCPDGRIRGMMKFYGANRTGRWSSVGLQLQNLQQTHLEEVDFARNVVRRSDLETLKFCYGAVSDTLGQLVRSCLVPSPGCVFVDADFSAIEARVIAWLAGEEWVLEVFRTHGKIYEATASQMFGVPIEKIKKGNPEYELRQRGKVATLACGYQGGASAMAAMDIKKSIDPELYPGLVKQWRAANPNIVKYWGDVEKAAMLTLKTGAPHSAGYVTYLLQSDEATNQWFLVCKLPSGRQLFYVRPTISENRFGKEAIRYWGINDKKKWAEIDTYGGRLVENICQAVARDCLAVKLKPLADAGYPAVFSVHDEVITEHPEETADLKIVTGIMAEPIDWAPGLPLKAEGWVGKYFKKD